MVLVLLLALIAVPLLEIAVFIAVGGEIGLFATLALVALTAVVGTFLLRWRGLFLWARFQQQLARGVFPGQALFDGLCLVASGALLLTPGFVTDGIGLLLFFAPVREGLRRLIWSHLSHAPQGGKGGSKGPGGRGPWIDGDTIEGEYHVVDETPPRTPPGGPGTPR